MTDRLSTLILAPWCQSLWAISPGLFLLYDRVVIDERDFQYLENPTADTPYASARASAVRQLASWGVLDRVDYRTHLPGATRVRIASHARDAVQILLRDDINNMNSRFRELALHAHRDYQKYLENLISIIPGEDVATVLKQRARWEMVNERIRCLESLRVTDPMTEEIAWTLERVYAKAPAGLVIAGSFQAATLYDSDEYRPFIAPMLAGVSRVEYFDPAAMLGSYHVLLAALEKKAVPELSMADEHELFVRLKDHTDILSLRSALRRIEFIFGELLKERQDLVRTKLARDLQLAEQEYEGESERARENFGRRMRWRGMQSIAGALAGWLRPWLDELKRTQDMRSDKRTRDSIPTTSDMAASLFMVSEIWRRRALPDHASSQDPRTVETASIWGRGDRAVPWYESA